MPSIKCRYVENPRSGPFNRNVTYLCLLQIVHRYGCNLYTDFRLKAYGFAGDTKAGTLIAKDRYGNKYYENLQDELPRMNHGASSSGIIGSLLFSPNEMGRLQGKGV